MSWEYKIAQPETKGFGIGSSKKLDAQAEEFLNRLGREGWECYHVNTDAYPHAFYLKRPR